ncbi:hypothetical protein HELRODRAFT_178588 [Helobdella robusta]|uniref:Uncharacterized protein n=1 Tax=Helobdella robusta TaxID=6412 RepID=T1FDF4_HELRO|nr:hypothetical protein HELRODRAFT_178588 [Helobdella robusta]ESN96801.1 hypothetical protein HELRODRAFT_178588 [Helobdella robusta]
MFVVINDVLYFLINYFDLLDKESFIYNVSEFYTLKDISGAVKLLKNDYEAVKGSNWVDDVALKTPIESQNGFELVEPRKRRADSPSHNRSNVKNLVGRRLPQNSKIAASSLMTSRKFYHISNVARCASENRIEHLRLIGVEAISCHPAFEKSIEINPKDTNQSTSIRLWIDSKFIDIVENIDSWPIQVKVREWIFPQSFSQTVQTPQFTMASDIDPDVNYYGGGVGLFLHQDLAVQELVDLRSSSQGYESMAIEISVKDNRKMVIIVFYMPPDSDPFVVTDQLSNVLRMNKALRQKSLSVIDNIYTNNLVSHVSGIIFIDILDHLPIFIIAEEKVLDVEVEVVDKLCFSRQNLEKRGKLKKQPNACKKVTLSK